MFDLDSSTSVQVGQVPLNLGSPPIYLTQGQGISKTNTNLGAPAHACERTHVSTHASAPAHLGINTKSPTPPLPSALVSRFALQSAARSLLPKERVANCLRLRVFHSRPVQVLYVPATQTAHYGNLTVCGSVWNCPVCASKITERRRVELQQALNEWGTGWGGQTLMMTFTVQHSQAESCSYVLEGLLRAHNKFWSGMPAKRFKSRYGIAGKIRALEVTYGQNGWHAHLHVLLFLDADNLLFLADMRAAAAERWRSILARDGRFASVAHGVDIRGADDLAGDYLAKMGLAPAGGWTQAHELAKSHVKAGRDGSLTPNALLLHFFAGDVEAGRLWQEYATAFKGKRQLVWSDDLRALLCLAPEKSDEELAQEQDRNAAALAQLDFEQWRAVLGNDIRAEVLQAVRAAALATGGDLELISQALRLFLEEFGIFGVEYPGLVSPGADQVTQESVTAQPAGLSSYAIFSLQSHSSGAGAFFRQ